MVARIDPKRAKLYPEELPEASAITASASGASIASYAAFSPYAMFVKNIATGQTPDVTLRIDNDGGHAVVESPFVARPERLFSPVDIACYDSLDMWAVGSAYRTYCTYLLRITKMTVFEKIRYGLPLNTDEQALDSSFEISKKFSAGILRGLDVQEFKKTYEVARLVTVAANSSTGVGRIINVKSGEKAVLLGISVDSSMTSTRFGGAGPNDTYFTLNRDKIDTAHIKLDINAMPGIDVEVPCYIPAVDRHEVIIESTTGITNLPVRYRYGVAPLTLLEKIKWEQPISDSDQVIIDELGLEDAILAGVF
ncbi:MAG: hypothetical protein PHH85_02050 [Candidatus Methanoperedens sp.]|nr:hypothetical protein [Candidatus Methanoperedens sp.]